jgi:hypothetical protein
MYIYESHLGGFYASDEVIDPETLYCETCGDSDDLLGEFETAEDFIKAIAHQGIDVDGEGGWNPNYIIEFIQEAFKITLTLDQLKSMYSRYKTPNEEE